MHEGEETGAQPVGLTFSFFALLPDLPCRRLPAYHGGTRRPHLGDVVSRAGIWKD